MFYRIRSEKLNAVIEPCTIEQAASFTQQNPEDIEWAIEEYGRCDAWSFDDPTDMITIVEVGTWIEELRI